MANPQVDSSPQLEPLGYAGADLNRSGRRATGLGVVSICIACLSLAWNCIGENAAVRRIESAYHVAAILRQQQKAVQAASARIQQQQAVANGIQFRALKPKEISGVLDYINSELAKRSVSLNEAQSRALRKLLSQDGQKLIDPSVPLGSQREGQLQMVMPLPSGSGSVLILVNHGSAYSMYRIRLDQAGTETPYSATPLLQNTTSPAPSPGQVQMVFQRWYRGGVVLTVIFGVGALLAILLLVAGVRLVQMNPRGLSLHWWYAGAKLAVGAGAVIFGFRASQIGVTPDIGFYVALALVGCVYPICLLFMLRQVRV
jgi:hypothetical protein